MKKQKLEDNNKKLIETRYEQAKKKICIGFHLKGIPKTEKTLEWIDMRTDIKRIDDSCYFIRGDN